MTKLKGLRHEVKDNAGHDSHAWDWLDSILGKWGAMFTKMVIMIGIALVVMGVVFCYVLPLLKSLLIQTTVKQMSVKTVITNPFVEVYPVFGAPGQYTD